MGPDFVCVGAPRSGTSWIYEVLNRHPALWLPPIKELHYFDEPVRSKRYYGHLRMRLISGLWINRPFSWFDVRYFLGRRSDAWYCDLFDQGRRRSLVTGEITPAYSTLDEASLRKLRELNSDARLIYIMRDPIMRSWSAVMKRRRMRGVPDISSDQDAIAYANTEGVSKRSSYLDNIERFERVFPRAQIFYGFFEQLAEAPAEFAVDLLTFLGVEPGDVSRLLPRAPVNVAAGGKPPPAAFARAMAAAYLPWVEKLCLKFDGAPHVWRARYEALLDERKLTSMESLG